MARGVCFWGGVLCQHTAMGSMGVWPHFGCWIGWRKCSLHIEKWRRSVAAKSLCRPWRQYQWLELGSCNRAMSLAFGEFRLSCSVCREIELAGRKEIRYWRHGRKSQDMAGKHHVSAIWNRGWTRIPSTLRMGERCGLVQQHWNFLWSDSNLWRRPEAQDMEVSAEQK